ncbi:hypothetical protein E1212_22545 [Jiangella ureilytica]|uniref:Nuclear transport factor 2 family protein n=1 Tax=Jiangella ureilytica TaxID=2530374 RepID=A0A4V2XW53_9ACTN|nr:hypothetical protein [Jiangella ureilytica]TDC47975.1 hypothetical protein E1212_22545 [Jiangella ureilytica]
MTPRRATAPVLTAAVLMLAACGGGGEEPQGLETTTAPATSAEPTPTEDPDAAAVAAIEAQYQAYWDTVIAMENVQDEAASYAALQQVAIELIAQTQIANLRGLVDANVTRDGAPVVGPPQVTVDGDTARAEGCVDEDPWNVYYNGELVEDRELGGSQPRVFDLEQVEGRWLISELVDQTEATITC